MVELLKNQAWSNVLLTDAGFYYDNELDKPLTALIKCFKKMLCKPLAEATVLFIPTAAMQDVDKAEEISKRLRNELLHMGVSPANIVIHDIDGSLTEQDVMAFDVIYFSGGNTPFLAKHVRETGFDKIVRNFVYANKVYVGMSAGSYLAMENFNVDGLPESNPTEYLGLGLINAYFTVHCKPGTPNRTDFPLPHISLKSNQAIIVRWDGYEVISEPVRMYEV
jgi:peptidase E